MPPSSSSSSCTGTATTLWHLSRGEALGSVSLSQPGVLFNPLNEELVTRGRERGGVPFSVLISRILNIVPHSLGKGTVSGGDPVTVSLVPWPPPLDDGGSGQMKGINALIAVIKFQINGSLFFPGTPIQRPIGGTLGGSLSCSPSSYCFFCTQVPRG